MTDILLTHFLNILFLKYIPKKKNTIQAIKTIVSTAFSKHTHFLQEMYLSSFYSCAMGVNGSP